MNKKAYSFLKEKFDGFQCNICNSDYGDGLSSPMVICTNKHIVCLSCTEDIIKRNGLRACCPFCKQHITKQSIKPSRQIKKYVEQMRNAVKQFEVEDSRIRRGLEKKIEEGSQDLLKQKQRNKILAEEIKGLKKQIQILKNNSTGRLSEIKLELQKQKKQNQRLRKELKDMMNQKRKDNGGMEKHFQLIQRQNQLLKKQLAKYEDLSKNNKISILPKKQNIPFNLDSLRQSSGGMMIQLKSQRSLTLNQPTYSSKQQLSLNKGYIRFNAVSSWQSRVSLITNIGVNLFKISMQITSNEEYIANNLAVPLAQFSVKMSSFRGNFDLKKNVTSNQIRVFFTLLSCTSFSQSSGQCLDQLECNYDWTQTVTKLQIRVALKQSRQYSSSYSYVWLISYRVKIRAMQMVKVYQGRSRLIRNQSKDLANQHIQLIIKFREFGKILANFTSMVLFDLSFYHQLDNKDWWDNLVASLNGIGTLQTVIVRVGKGESIINPNWTDSLNKKIKVQIRQL